MKNNHSIRMEDESFKKLKEMAKSKDMSIGDYTEYLIDYAAKNGIDPTISINAIMQENNKRLNQVIAYMRQHEDKALYHILDTNKKILESMNTFLKLQALKTS